MSERGYLIGGRLAILGQGAPASAVPEYAIGGAPNGVNPAFDEEAETKRLVFEALGELDDIDLAYNDVLVAKHLRTHVAQGLIASTFTENEDRYTGKVGLVLKVGHRAFVDDDRNQFYGWSVKRGDWVFYRNSDGWDMNIARLGRTAQQSVECRVIQDAHIRGRVKYPGRLY